MRFKKTFILYLYIDPEVPDLMCGKLQKPSGRETFPFKDETALISLLYQLGGTAAQNENSNPKEITS